jgi:hypothetical protein
MATCSAFAFAPAKGKLPGKEMDKTLTQAGSPPIAETLAAALILAVGIGFGRFAFTGMYPLMVRDGVISVSAGSLAASANYAGYLVGALLVSYAKHVSSVRLSKLALLGTLVCLAGLAIHGGAGFVIGVRFVAGVLSAIAMVCASVWLFHIVGYHHGAPMLYAGVGLGIVISAELIALGNRLGFVSSTVWIGLGVAGALVCALAWPRLRRVSEAGSVWKADKGDEADGSHQAIDGRPMLAPWTLVAVYGLAGFGYIVTATYLPLFVKDALGNIDPVHLWAAFGLGAAPSCFLWHALHRRLGVRASLALNLIAQAVGVVLPTLSATPLSYLASAILVGGTFMGTATIAMPAARRAAARTRFNVMATMTAAYGVGQIAGPLVSNALVAHTHSFDQPLLFAGGALVVGALACLV